MSGFPHGPVPSGALVSRHVETVQSQETCWIWCGVVTCVLSWNAHSCIRQPTTDYLQRKRLLCEWIVLFGLSVCLSVCVLGRCYKNMRPFTAMAVHSKYYCTRLLVLTKGGFPTLITCFGYALVTLTFVLEINGFSVTICNKNITETSYRKETLKYHSRKAIFLCLGN